MKLLITGAAGRLGSVVTRHLIEAGHEVRATDRKTDPDLGFPVKITNLLVRETAYELVDGVEAIVHLANHPTAQSRLAQDVFNENVSMNMNVFQAAAELGVKKVVFASSIQTMIGDRVWQDAAEQLPSGLQYLPMDSDTPVNAGNPYALSKAVSESMLQYFAKFFGMSAVALRFPWLSEAEHMRYRHSTRRGFWKTYLDEAFSILSMPDAARLIDACLRAELPGFRAYFPAARSPRIDLSPREIVERFFQGVPLRKPIETLDALVDTTRIQREVGWAPLDEPPAVNASEGK